MQSMVTFDNEEPDANDLRNKRLMHAWVSVTSVINN